MKPLIILLLSLLTYVSCKGQNNKEDNFEDLYIYVNHSNFIGSKGDYTVRFSI